MAGRGPVPKPVGQRRRRNTAKDTPAAPKKAPTKRKPAAPATRDASPGSPSDTSHDVERRKPPLPLGESYKLRVWDQQLQEHQETVVPFGDEARAWYEAYANTAIAREMTLVHWRALRRAAVLVDRFERGDHGQADAIRKIETNFGGSPYDQRRMGLDPPADPDDPTAEQPPAPATAAAGGTVTDIRTRLSKPKR